MALAAQTIYLEKLQTVLKDDLTETESKIKGDGNVDTILEQQLKRLQDGLNFISKCFDMLKTKPIPTDYELNLNKSRAGKTIPFGDLKNGFDAMLRRLVFLLLAGDNQKLIFDVLHRLEGKNSIVGYHKAKMFDVLTQIQLIITSAGNKTEPKKWI